VSIYKRESVCVCILKTYPFVTASISGSNHGGVSGVHLLGVEGPGGGGESHGEGSEDHGELHFDWFLVVGFGCLSE
jgi:hypothetical protein